MHPVVIPQAAEADARAGLEWNVTPADGQRILSLANLQCWFSTSVPGDRISYFRGFLALDRGPGSRFGEEAGLELDRVATALMSMAEVGQIHLIQRRNGANDYTYIVVHARSNRRGSCSSARETVS